MKNFDFASGGKELLNLIEPLWEKLNRHHEISSSNFSHKFRNLTFEVRKNKFINDDSLKVKVDLIRDVDKDAYIGYCISTVNKDLAGEVDSLYIENEYRKFGLGDKLMTGALAWLDDKGAKTKIIVVAEGNENVLEFYKRFGFYTRRIVLEQIKDQGAK